MSLSTVIYAFVVVIGLLTAGWQLITLHSRPPRGRAGAAATRHRRSPRAQTGKERYAAGHEFRMGMLAIFGGALGIAIKYDAPPLWLILVTGCAVVLVWDRARWLSYRQQRRI